MLLWFKMQRKKRFPHRQFFSQKNKKKREKPFSKQRFSTSAGFLFRIKRNLLMAFPFQAQINRQDCAASCLLMLARFYGCAQWERHIRAGCPATEQGSSIEQVLQTAKGIGLKALAVRLPPSGPQSLQSIPLPAMAYLPEGHFVVLYQRKGSRLQLADPALGKQSIEETAFLERWLAKGQKQGILLLFEPQAAFFGQCPDRSSPWQGLGKYIRPQRRRFGLLIASLVLGAAFQLVFPFLTQAVVDTAIPTKDISLIYLLLLGHISLFAAQAALQIARNWQLLLLGGEMQVQMLGDFVRKILQLPQRFLDQRLAGDLLQRLQDHQRIERLLSSAALRLLFAALSFVVFTAVLAWYSGWILLLFLLGSALYLAWILAFLQKRRQLDEAYFRARSEQKEDFLELLQGQSDIRLHQLEPSVQKRWDAVQEKLFQLQKRSLRLANYQDNGAQLLNQIKNSGLTFVAAVGVVQDDLTLGMMLAIQFILGQLNVPLNELVAFIQQGQDARLSWARIQEIRQQPEEQRGSQVLPPPSSIRLQQLAFRYHPHDDYLFEKLNLLLPVGKISLLQGASGVGKTTLLRLLLGLYFPEKGAILLGKQALSETDPQAWRAACGVIWEQSYLFRESIAYNISLEAQPNWAALRRAVQQAQLSGFIEKLPQSYQSQLGPNGLQISKGQRQRLLLARLFYRNPSYVFLDEPLQGLDQATAQAVEAALRAFLRGKTCLWISHQSLAADICYQWEALISD